MPNLLFHQLSEQELPALFGLMRELYPQQHMRLDEAVTRKAIQALLSDPSLGQICLIYRGDELAGYFVLTFCFSLEFHGRFGLLDELYIREAFRGQKLGKAVIAFAENVCRQKCIRALRLEVARDNLVAQGLYRASGFAEESRHLFTKWL
jgi:ribosomal protein S18 acetylase RimI-like enzyme